MPGCNGWLSWAQIKLRKAKEKAYANRMWTKMTKAQRTLWYAKDPAMRKLCKGPGIV